ncbi:Hypothetical predicted protein [Mytilus galloprovincialis]|uniref:Uncharacterized protein n=1 Tax=Mytilus galloprovincialis TaxID=29158 RepID=A0A8B6E6H3_MYTGA|nr:Hypothetical predicted protein [Mytilus galloprovincialis]
METSDQLPDEITAVISLVESQTADWILTKRNGKYSIKIKWRQIERQKTVTKKRSSKARQDRNNRRRQAFLSRKKLQPSGDPTLNTEELETTAPPPNDDILEIPPIITDMETGTQDTSIDSNPSASQDSADETLIDTPTRTMEIRKSSEEDPAREGAEGRSTKEQEKDTDKKRERKKKQLEACSYTRGLRVKKICLDLPQQMYVLDIDSPDQNLYLLVRSDTLQLDNFIFKDQRADTYNYIKRSFDTWLDVRNTKNFLYSLERIKEIEKFSKELKLKLL